MKGRDLEDLLTLFDGVLSTEDVIAAKLNGQVAATITSERIKRNMNQTEFATLLGVNQSQVSKWESGDCNFTLNKIAAIAAILGISPTITFQQIPQESTRSNSASSKIVNFSSIKKEKVYMPQYTKSITSDFREG